MTCQRMEGSESSSQSMTDFLGSGPSRRGVFVAICCHFLALIQAVRNPGIVPCPSLRERFPTRLSSPTDVSWHFPAVARQ